MKCYKEKVKKKKFYVLHTYYQRGNVAFCNLTFNKERTEHKKHEKDKKHNTVSHVR
mgnify:CR=1 FL=1